MKHLCILLLLCILKQSAFSQAVDENAIIGHWKIQKMAAPGMTLDLNDKAATRKVFFKANKGRDSAALEQKFRQAMAQLGKTFFEFKADHTYTVSGFAEKSQDGAVEKGRFQFLPQTMELKLLEKAAKGTGTLLKVKLLNNNTTLILTGTDEPEGNLVLTFSK